MADNSNQYKVLKLPLWAAGFVVLCLFLSRSGQQDSPTVRPVIDSQSEARLIHEGIEYGNAELAAGTYSIGQVERNLRLRLKLDETPERKREVAGGLYAVASHHLEQGNTIEAARIAQQAADLAPGTLLAARCWFLCGQASSVTSPELPLSIRYFERANVAVLDVLQQHPDDAEALALRGNVLQRLSQTQSRFGLNEMAIQHVRELTGKTPVALAQTPGDRLRAMVALRQLLSQAGQPVEAARWRLLAEEYGLSDAVPAAEALHVLAESARREAAVPSESSYNALRKLWDAQRFESLPEWCQIGDELTSADFFHEPPQLADFELVSGKLLNQLPQVLEILPPESAQRAELESLYATNLLLAADAAKGRADQAEVARLVKLFETRFHGRDVNFISPLARPAQRMQRIAEIYRSIMTGHAEQLRKIQASDNTPPHR